MLMSAICRYLNAVQTTAQHLLRYLAAAVVVNKRRRSLLKDMVKVRPALCVAICGPWVMTLTLWADVSPRCAYFDTGSLHCLYHLCEDTPCWVTTERGTSTRHVLRKI